MIPKVATNSQNCSRKMIMHESARAAFSSYMRALNISNEETVLLPAYIGWSAREGSGVFDPVRELNVKHAFYAMDEKLNIDVDSLKDAFENHNVKLFVIIHYFGFVDPNYEKVIQLARSYGVKILEDEAHSFYTDLVGGVSGRLGDACIFSLHKMFPLNGGGVLCLNQSEDVDVEDRSCDFTFPYSFDFYEIARKRIDNALLLEALLKDKSAEVELLKDEIPAGNVPQTYPVLIKNVSRDQLYQVMNDSGFGVVSLYHTMIEHVTKEEFERSHFVSRRILNLPVHQDVEPQMLEGLVDNLIESIRSLRT